MMFIESKQRKKKSRNFCDDFDKFLFDCIYISIIIIYDYIHIKKLNI